jgi:hypothetical protein
LKELFPLTAVRETRLPEERNAARRTKEPKQNKKKAATGQTHDANPRNVTLRVWAYCIIVVSEPQRQISDKNDDLLTKTIAKQHTERDKSTLKNDPANGLKK